MSSISNLDLLKNKTNYKIQKKLKNMINKSIKEKTLKIIYKNSPFNNPSMNLEKNKKWVKC